MPNRIAREAAPVGVYLAGQCVAVGMLELLCVARRSRLIGRLTAWDGKHYLAIAEHGYTWSTARDVLGSPAFFPGYPAVVAAVHAATRLPFTAAALTVSVLAGIAFACAIPRLARHVPGMDRRAALVAVAVIAVSPLSVVFSMAYGEALFCALACWTLVAVLNGRWWLATILAPASGLVRVSGLALAAALLTVTAAAIVRRHWSLAVRSGVVGVAAAAGTGAWILGSGIRMGSAFAWFTTENKDWRSHIDFGAATIRYIHMAATSAPDLMTVATAAALIAAVALLVCAFAQRQPLLLLAYGCATVAEVVGSAGLMYSRIRLLIPAFTIVLPVASWLARLRRSSAIAAIAALAIAGSWFGAYALTIWRHAI